MFIISHHSTHLTDKTKVTLAVGHFDALLQLCFLPSQPLFLVCPQVVSAHFPPAQALDFIVAILEVLVSGNEACAMAAGQWLLAILQDCVGALEAQVILTKTFARLSHQC